MRNNFLQSARSALACALVSLFLASTLAHGQAKRLVLLKVDGLPYHEVERFVRELDPHTGKSLLPWIDHVFYKSGTRLENFYTRGMSLSGPSWSLLDTGQHLQIKGNVEFDRFTLHSYDYLNFIPFWIANVASRRIDMPGPETLDELGIPLLADAYPYTERHLSFQLYQRGLRWTTLERGLKNRFTSRSPGDLFYEWNTGINSRSILFEQQERELLQKLSDPKIRYLDFYTTDFDHATHHNRDRESHLHALQELDALVGRIWMGIRKSPLAEETAFVLVSDHGTNSDERVYSQGYNLVKLLASAEGGGHHVVTKRRLMNDYAVKGVYPLIPLIHTTSQQSFYLKGQSTAYPTALVDFDGNERASIHLRNSNFNLIHILLQQLQRKDLAPDLRRAATEALFSSIASHRAVWQRTIDELNEELGALRRLIEKQRARVETQQKKFTKEEQDAGKHHESVRQFARLDSWTTDERKYKQYVDALTKILALRREAFDPLKLRIEDLISAGAMGEHNNVADMSRYIVGLSPSGLVLKMDGSLDNEKSFQRVNYFSLLPNLVARNNVQPGVASRPVDFVALRIPVESFGNTLVGDLRAEQAIWLQSAAERQALILSRTGTDGRPLLRYLPVANLRQTEDGAITFERPMWNAGFPLKIWEDANLELPAGHERATWLGEWHTDTEWLRAAHRTLYSNAVVGLHEQLARHSYERLDANAEAITKDERLIRRFRLRQRALVESDLLVLANDQWNFDVRGFNPGGNHGSFFRVSTRSTLMFAGGARTGIPRGYVIAEPYDSLSFVPTLFALTGQLDSGARPVPILWQMGFRSFPGPIIKDLFPQIEKDAAPIANSLNLQQNF